MKYKYSFLYFSLVAALLLCGSCEKEVHIDLNTSKPRLVVNGGIGNVNLYRTIGFYDKIMPPESGALVIVYDNIDQRDTFKEWSPGQYSSTEVKLAQSDDPDSLKSPYPGNHGINKIKAIAGRTYHLYIKTRDGAVYEASSTLPKLVRIDTLYFEWDVANQNYTYSCQFRDPPNIENYYKLTAFPHNLDGFLVSDKLTDGQLMSFTFQRRVGFNYNVIVYLESIDKAAYDFYRSIPDTREDLDQFLSAPPANPKTNISNGGLGLFSASTTSFISKFVK